MAVNRDNVIGPDNDRIDLSYGLHEVAPNRRVKRVCDLVAASVGLIILLPTLLLAAIAVKLTSRGSIFIRETRYGYGNRPFQILKFRSAEADRLSRRVTWVGYILRLSGADGLPQLFDVLRGQMSIVGPSLFHSPQHRFERIPSPLRDAKPGMIGLTLVSTPAQLETFEQRRRDDLFYVQNWSLFLDLQIVLWTVFEGFPSNRYTQRQSAVRTSLN